MPSRQRKWNQSVGFTARVVLCFMFLKLFFERCKVGNRLFGWGKWLLSYFFYNNKEMILLQAPSKKVVGNGMEKYSRILKSLQEMRGLKS